MTETTLQHNILRYAAPCTDDGKQFTQRDRIDLIEGDLQGSAYCLYQLSPLAHIYRHMDYVEGAPTVLISTHVDSLYDEYQACSEGAFLIGTFDNAATNAIAVNLMRGNKLPPQALIAFTGNEESGMAGVDQAIQLLKKATGNSNHLEFVLTLDVTYEGYPEKAYTVENVFCRETLLSGSILTFDEDEDVAEYLRKILNDPKAVHDENDYADESCQYDEHDLNGASFCLPCDPVDGEDMHSEEGVRIMKKAVDKYAETLAALVNKLAIDFGSIDFSPRA